MLQFRQIRAKKKIIIIMVSFHCVVLLCCHVIGVVVVFLFSQTKDSLRKMFSNVTIESSMYRSDTIETKLNQIEFIPHSELNLIIGAPLRVGWI